MWSISSLPARLHSDQLWRDSLIDIGDGFQHTLAAVTRLVAIAQLDRFILAGGGSGGHRR